MRDTFDYDEWLESVRGREIVVDNEDDHGRVLGVMEPKGFPVRRETYCGKCHAFRMLVGGEDDAIGHCPICGRTPGVLELGTDELPDEPQPAYIREESA